MGKMIEVEGFKAFRGKMEVELPILLEKMEIDGEWLYMPDPDCWYCKGKSYPAEFCKVLEVE